MRKEAEAHAAEDKRKLELINARNEADAAIYELEKVLKEHDAKIGASEKEAVRSAIERTKQAASKDDAGGDPASGERPEGSGAEPGAVCARRRGRPGRWPRRGTGAECGRRQGRAG